MDQHPKSKLGQNPEFIYLIRSQNSFIRFHNNFFRLHNSFIRILKKLHSDFKRLCFEVYAGRESVPPRPLLHVPVCVPSCSGTLQVSRNIFIALLYYFYFLSLFHLKFGGHKPITNVPDFLHIPYSRTRYFTPTFPPTTTFVSATVNCCRVPIFTFK